VERRKAQSITLVTSPHSAVPFAASRLRVSPSQLKIRTRQPPGLNPDNPHIPVMSPHVVNQILLFLSINVFCQSLVHRKTRCESQRLSFD